MSIPVQVLPGDTNLPPTLRGSVLEVEVGGSATTVDLATAAEDPDGDPLDFALGEAELPEGVTAEIADGRLAVTASADATLGASAEQPIT
ncbi:MAG TPA: Ig-like domain-containing protein, partial [Brachybacterium paraconglomeratum]|nr:Ig-like domain-containing protein [Brachybacterium paraconglomeratum]